MPSRQQKYTLSFDIGASSIKAAVLDPAGHMVSDHLKVDTPRRATPNRLVRELVKLAEPVSGYHRISVGFPGIVHRNVVYAFPASGRPEYRRFDLARALREELGHPVRVVNDADMHALGVITGEGVELVITLGTGLGTSLFIDGAFGPGVQFAPPPSRMGPRGGEYGKAALASIGHERWNARVRRLIRALRFITNFDHLYIGGGNADKLTFRKPRDVSIVDNMAAIVGGVRLWQWG